VLVLRERSGNTGISGVIYWHLITTDWSWFQFLVHCRFFEMSRQPPTPMIRATSGNAVTMYHSGFCVITYSFLLNFSLCSVAWTVNTVGIGTAQPTWTWFTHFCNVRWLNCIINSNKIQIHSACKCYFCSVLIRTTI